MTEGSIGELSIGTFHTGEERGVKTGQIGGISVFILAVLAFGGDSGTQDAGDVDPVVKVSV